MDDVQSFIIDRITELRLAYKVSEYQMSLELGMSKSYIQSITSGKNLPSARQLLNIADYFGLSLSEFFSESEKMTLAQSKAISSIQSMNDQDVKLLLEIIERFNRETKPNSRQKD